MADGRPLCLDLKRQFELARRLSPLAENMWRYVEDMEAKGWGAFRPLIDFEMSFCLPDERLLYRRMRIERAKMRLCSANGRYYGDGLPTPSEFIAAQRADRDAKLGRPFDPAVDPYWMSQVTEYGRRMERLSEEKPAEFRAKKFAADEKQKQRKQQELSELASVLPQRPPRDVDEIPSCYIVAMNNLAHSIGFALHLDKPSDRKPVYVRHLMAEWNLCLTSEPLVWYPGRNDGQARLSLSMQCGDVCSALKDHGRRDQFLLIEFGELIPGFDSAYSRFSSLKELDLVLRARIGLLSLVVEEIARLLQSGLENLCQAGAPIGAARYD